MWCAIIRKSNRYFSSILFSTAGDGQNAWYNEKGEVCDRNFLTLKLEALGPFLFGQSTLCEKVKYIKLGGLLL